MTQSPDDSVDEQVWLDMYFGGRLHTLLTSASSNVDPMFMRKHFMVGAWWLISNVVVWTGDSGTLSL